MKRVLFLSFFVIVPLVFFGCSSGGSSGNSLSIDGLTVHEIAVLISELTEKGEYSFTAVDYEETSCEELKEALYRFERNSGITVSLDLYNTTKLEIGKEAFGYSGSGSEDSALVSIVLPKNCTEIGDYAFDRCVYLKSITIPSTVKSIGTSVFRNTSALTSLSVPEGVTSIGSYAFADSNLSKVYLPSTLSEIGNYAFYNCTSLKTIEMKGTEPITISKYMFYNCTALTSVTLSSGLTEIEERAFENCSKLQEITIPKNVIYIAPYAFRGCDKLSSAVFEDTSNWFVYYKGVYITYNIDVSEDIEDASKAASYLHGYYYNYDWYKP